MLEAPHGESRGGEVQHSEEGLPLYPRVGAGEVRPTYLTEVLWRQAQRWLSYPGPGEAFGDHSCCPSMMRPRMGPPQETAEAWPSSPSLAGCGREAAGRWT
ncbi:hypothetical protein E2C01_061352 [Portunus trituberculatus]|uniref:Uncharacterized protein n=1 Tax=Portunus trituberculatus TaxID=210409 RepID=A0A5B7HB27_PORTR|nr:hypothetical protein [Portunus trituberculatus]